jgi:hypothetical protein
VLQGSLASPSHASPPFAGAGLVHVRVFVPPPHATLHSENALQPPLTGGGHACVLQV